MNILKVADMALNVVHSMPKTIQKANHTLSSTNASSQRLTSALDCLAASTIPAIKKTNKNQNLPEFIYHITSKENYEKILSDGKMQISDFEAQSKCGCKGIYFIDKDNFLNKWVGRKEPELFGSDGDIGELLMLWTCKGSNGSVAIKIPTSKLDLSQLRFRPYIEACRETVEKFNPDTLDIESEMVKKGLSIDDLSKYTNTNEPIEYVYMGKITPDMFSECKETSFSKNMREMINNLFNN